ncbi:MAG TPA: D-alanyl-D-alanine carboxypeptidase family protein [Blastocatellia bacterium]|nr:D-alanyl-D-alanine carboxypeptidase family protein [Blastocatellia bacterium]
MFIFAVEASAYARDTGCNKCVGQTRAGGRLNRSAKYIKDAPCHAKGYVNPKVAGKLNAAMRDMRRAGIKPKLTSAWRSSEKQAALRRCSLSSRCRRANPGLYRALPPGQSLHEAGFAVDIAGVAAGPRGAKRVTPRGRRIVSIMRRNGFQWPYGLKDPAHFEANPRHYGYRNAKQAIARSQGICDAKPPASTARRSGRGSVRYVPAKVSNAKTRPRNSRA